MNVFIKSLESVTRCICLTSGIKPKTFTVVVALSIVISIVGTKSGIFSWTKLSTFRTSSVTSSEESE